MKVFVSWSGEYSQAVASLLKKYVPLLLHDVELFVSCHDIESGTKWSHRLSSELDATNYGIICLSPTNLTAPWILFEAGALSKFEDSSLCSLLIGDLSPEDVSSPLSQFRNRRFQKNDFRHLLSDVNGRQKKPVEPEQFDILFDTFWPRIHEEYVGIGNQLPKDHVERASKRDDRELLEEIVFRIRGMERFAMRGFPFEDISPERLLDLPVTHDTLRTYTDWKFPGLDALPHLQTALLRDLRTKSYPTLRYIEDAVNRAMPAVRAYASERPEVFTGGTDYITKSLGFVDTDFRDRHGFADVTLAAFKRYAKLVEP